MSEEKNITAQKEDKAEKKLKISKKTLAKKAQAKSVDKFVYERIDENRKYELTVILSPDLTEKKRAEKLVAIKKMIANEGGTILFEDLTMGIRKFCYRIKSKWNGFYAIYHLDLKASSLSELNTSLRLDTEILRYLLIKLPEDFVSVKYEDLKDKYEIKEAPLRPTRKPEMAVSRDKTSEQRLPEKANEKTIEGSAEKILIKEPVEKPVKDDEIIVNKEEPSEPKKKLTSEPKKQDTPEKDHLKELDEKLDKLLLSDDL
jgi:small subunit ribosomal protein S6